MREMCLVLLTPLQWLSLKSGNGGVENCVCVYVCVCESQMHTDSLGQQDPEVILGQWCVLSPYHPLPSTGLG